MQIQASNAVESLTIGGAVFFNLTSLITLYLPIAQATGSNGTFRKPGAGAGYQVTAGKTLTIRAISCNAHAAANVYPYYADNDTGQETATALTNGVFFNAAKATSGDFEIPVNVRSQYELYFPIPATKFPGGQTALAGGVGMVMAYGYEA